MGKGAKVTPDEVKEAAAQDWGIPPTCDVFERKAEDTARQLVSGVDPTVAKVRVFVVDRGQQHRVMIGSVSEWPPSDVSTGWIIETFGPGTYIVKGFNHASDKVCEGRVSFWDPATRAPLGGDSGTPKSDNRARVSEAIAQLAELTTLQAAARAQGGGSDSRATDWPGIAVGIAGIVGALAPVLTRKENDTATAALIELAKQKNPAANGSGSANFQEMMAVLSFGMTLAEKKSGKSIEDKEHPVWKMVPTIVDTVGVPLCCTLATAILGPEKAKPVIEAINQHTQARVEEARADQAVAGADPNVVDTQGATVQ